jgi:hypothetical protein
MAHEGQPAITFGGSALTCIQSSQLTVNGEDISYYCGGNKLYIAGTDDIELTASFAVTRSQVAMIESMLRGTNGVMEYHPGGDTTGRSEYTTTNATTTSFVHTSSPGTFQAVDVTWRWDDYTFTSGGAV